VNIGSIVKGYASFTSCTGIFRKSQVKYVNNFSIFVRVQTFIYANQIDEQDRSIQNGYRLKSSHFELSLLY